MKTRNKNAEAKRSKLKNAFLKGGAIVISFILISFTVSAQGFWKQLFTESSLGNIAMIMVGSTETKTSAGINNPASYARHTEIESFSNTVKTEKDKPLNLEAWMTDANYFGDTSMNIAEANDPGLELDDWMINNKYFSADSDIQTEKDPDIKLEKWMTSDNFGRM